MKKIALLMALLMLVFSLAACGEKTEAPQTTATPAGTEEQEQTEATPAVDADGCKHEMEVELLSEPDCTNNGTKRSTCKICGEIITEEVPALGHDGSGASCEEPSTCANCGEVVEDAWGHEDEDGVCKYCGIGMTGAKATEATEAEQ